MKFTVTFKDPDTLDDAIKEAVDRDVAKVALDDDTEHEAVAEVRRAKTKEACMQWLAYGEYVSIEIDTDAGTATVLEKTS